jgi:L-alanine-DL-glutamate epimerase-like enolase superfamily enzyme
VLDGLEATLDPGQPAAARAHVAEALTAAPDVRSALDGALWELEALAAGCSVARLLGASTSSVPVTEQLFAVAAAQPREAWPRIRDRGTRCLKVKVSGDPAVDLSMLRRLRETVGPDVRLRIDANRGYTVDDARRVAEGLPTLGIDEWEEPVAASYGEVARLRAETGLRVILDECIRSHDDLENALACGAVDVLNLKLSRLGGITAALAYRERCALDGVEVLLGCNEDLGPGMAAVLHAAAAWQPFETEGVGWLRLGLDLGAPSPMPSAGRVELGDAPGWGLTVEPRTSARRASSRDLPQPVHVSSWTASFAAASIARKQHERACNVVPRMRWLARRAVNGRVGFRRSDPLQEVTR